MSKTILVTGSTDGIGLATVERLTGLGHRVLLHGRNPAKLAGVERDLRQRLPDANLRGYVADLSRLDEVEALADAVTRDQKELDVLINNAGVLRVPGRLTRDGLDVRFVVNTIAPYLLMQRLLPLLGADGRVVNLSSAAQSAVDIGALRGEVELADFEAYAQSKLALTSWSCKLGNERKADGPAVVAVNPGSLLGSKMVKDAFGTDGGDIGIGADILLRAALSAEFDSASGQYYDNDSGRFAPPHADALDPDKAGAILQAIEQILARLVATSHRSARQDDGR
ncbi:MAG: SDR family NAD(P)-dependent oxidoreductase [Gammaproteobacteria bacterium]|nr:SDR family NAD(P)-dependent oxidoreductase [Gammaproteobacteria bacterium]